MGKEKTISPVYLRIKSAFKDASDAEISRRLKEAGARVGKSAISQWKSGETSPSTDNLLLVSKLTGVPLEVLKGESDLNNSANEGGGEVDTSAPMTLERFVAELRALGVEDFHAIKSMKGLHASDMEEIIAVAKSNARATAQTMIQQRTKDKNK